MTSKSQAEIFTGLGIGALASVFVVGTMAARGPLIAAVAAVALPVAALVVLRPRYGVILLIFCMSFVEEFRGGIGEHAAGGDENLRSERTPFYSATVGIPALYIPDILVGGVLLLYLCKAILKRETMNLAVDKIGVGLLVLAGAVVLSMVVPLWGHYPFGPDVLDLSTIGRLTLPEKNVTDVARYLPVLQYKLFLILFPSYIIGLFFFRDDRDVDFTVKVVGVAMVGTVVLALARLANDPGMVRALVPVVFDTGSVALMAMAVFYSIGRWTSGHYRANKAVFQAVLSVALMIFIVLSFRRTMWGAIGLAILFFPFILPRRALPRLFAIIAFGLCVGLAAVIATPAGQALLQSVVSRAGETNLSQSSTLYRFAITVWVVQNFADIPLLGYGLAPLWNEKIQISLFSVSMENVHSLYIWILTRMGIVGIAASALATGLIFARMREVYRSTQDEHYQLMIGVIFLSVIMYLFNGIFNPVYANVRHLVPLGLSLALVTQMPSIMARRRAAATAAGVESDPSFLSGHRTP